MGGIELHTPQLPVDLPQVGGNICLIFNARLSLLIKTIHYVLPHSDASGVQATTYLSQLPLHSSTTTPPTITTVGIEMPPGAAMDERQQQAQSQQQQQQQQPAQGGGESLNLQ